MCKENDIYPMCTILTQNVSDVNTFQKKIDFSFIHKKMIFSLTLQSKLAQKLYKISQKWRNSKIRDIQHKSFAITNICGYHTEIISV